jgi:hypothetical protein
MSAGWLNGSEAQGFHLVRGAAAEIDDFDNKITTLFVSYKYIIIFFLREWSPWHGNVQMWFQL